MKKLLYLVGIIAAVTVCYLLMIIISPVIASLAETGASGIEAVSGNVTYAATTSAMRGMPMFLWFVPGAAAVIGCVFVIKKM